MINSSSYSRVMNVSSFNHTNQSMRRGAPFCALPPFTHEVTNVVTWILLILSFDGNSLIVAAFCTKRLPKTPVNVMIVNMAISDILLLMLEMQNKIADGYLDAGIASFFLCKLPMFLQTTTCNVSTLTMTVIAVDRFYSIVFAVRPPLLSKKSYPAVIAVIWFIAAGSCGHLLYAMKVFAFNNQLFCWFDWSPASMMDDSICLLLRCSFHCNICSVFWNHYFFASSNEELAARIGSIKTESKREQTCNWYVNYYSDDILCLVESPLCP